MAFPNGTLVADVVIKTPWAYRRNRYYYEADVAPTGITILEHMADAIFGHFSERYTALLAEECYFQRVECRYYGGGGSDIEANSTAEALPGEIAAPPEMLPADDEFADTLPDEVSLVIQVRTGSIGRQKRGRRFITGLSEQVQSKGEIADAYKSAAKNLANDMSEDIEVTGEGATTLHARHYNRKDNTLLPITKCYALANVGTRKDRRQPLVMTDRL